MNKNNLSIELQYFGKTSKKVLKLWDSSNLIFSNGSKNLRSVIYNGIKRVFFPNRSIGQVVTYSSNGSSEIQI